MKKQKIAIIGAGIAGLGSAYFLHDKYDITIFEKRDQAGGHSTTYTVKEPGGDVPIDMAVMIYNQANYPYFSRLIKELGVPTKPVTSTVGFQHIPSGLEYAVPVKSQVLAQPKNIFKPSFLKLVREILRFGKIAPQVLADEQYASLTVAEYAKEKGFSNAFLHQYLLPLAAALWSADPQLITKFPIVTLVRYFDNHHMLRSEPGIAADPAYTMNGFLGGTQVYRDRLISLFPKALRLNSAVKSVTRTKNGVEVITKKGESFAFNKVIFACHADEALAMLTDPSDLEKELLAPFHYKQNTIVLHTDHTVMPKNKRAWASFNSRINTEAGGKTTVEQNYYLNLLQNLPTKKDYFLAISSEHGVDPKTVMAKFTFSHVVYSVKAAQAQRRLGELNENGVTYFCGSYFRYAFHEDAFMSALNVCRLITGDAHLWEYNK